MEFKKLSDVEVVAEPAESANVLIEENGVIKKAPKTAVGGSNKHWVALNGDDWSVTASEGIYEALEDYFKNGGEPVFINTYFYEFDDFGRMYKYNYSSDVSIYSSNEDGCDFEIYGCRGVSFYIKKNGDHGYYWD